MIFEAPELDSAELEIVGRVEDLTRRLSYLGQPPVRWHGVLRRIAAARAVRGSNSIEGLVVTVDDAVAAIDGQSPLDADDEAWQAVTSYQQAMSYVLQLADDPHFQYSADLIRSLHFMIMQYDLAKRPGLWRPGPIYVRDDRTGTVVYEAPVAESVAALVEELVDGLNQRHTSLPGLVRAAMAHLNVAMVHPFRDGNGRIARCVQTLVIARSGTLAPPFSSIEEYLGSNTASYYAVLSEVGGSTWQPTRDPRPWLRFCLTAHYRQAHTLLQRAERTRELWDRLEEQIAAKNLPERTLLATVDAATGLRVRNSTYRTVADISMQLASRDLGRLVTAGLLTEHGERRGRYYTASPELRELASQVPAPQPIPDPFDDIS